MISTYVSVGCLLLSFFAMLIWRRGPVIARLAVSTVAMVVAIVSEYNRASEYVREDDVAEEAKRVRVQEAEAQKRLREGDLVQRCGERPARSEIAAHLAASANDPRSVEVVECSVASESTEDCYLLACSFRERNRQGALVLRAGKFGVRRGVVRTVEVPRDIGERQ